jgi:hypothetical protein
VERARDVHEPAFYSPLEFRLDRAQKADLYRRGYETTCSILPIKFPEDPSPLEPLQGSLSALPLPAISPHP